MGEPAYAVTIEEVGLHMPRSALTHEGFRAWVLSDEFPEGVKATFVDGEVLLDTSPEAIDTHNKVKDEVAYAIKDIVKRDDLGETYADGVLLTNPGVSLSTEPDYCFATWATLKTGRLRKVRREGDPQDSIELVGAPDLVVEVVSRWSKSKDTRVLREKYARAGIDEYWIIDARKETMQFQILQLQEGKYRETAQADMPQRSSIFGRYFTLLRSKNAIGDWTYRFEVTDG